MINKTLFEVSLPTNNEKKIIDYVSILNGSNRNKTCLLANKNTLILASNNIELYQLYAMIIKDYVLNRCNGKVDKNMRLDKIINSIDINKKGITKEDIYSLIDYIDADDGMRFELTSSFIDTVKSKNNRFQGIRECDKDVCVLLCNGLNDAIETRSEKKCIIKPYTRVSSK